MDTVYYLGDIQLDPGDEVAGITYYRDNLIVITKRGKIYRAIL
jgi:hypothetical protein